MLGEAGAAGVSAHRAAPRLYAVIFLLAVGREVGQMRVFLPFAPTSHPPGARIGSASSGPGAASHSATTMSDGSVRRAMSSRRRLRADRGQFLIELRLAPRRVRLLPLQCVPVDRGG